MNKNDLVAAIAEDTAKSKVDVTAVLASLAGVTSKALKSGGHVTLNGIGKLSSASVMLGRPATRLRALWSMCPPKPLLSSRSRRIWPKRSLEGGAAAKDGQPASSLGILRPPPLRAGLSPRVSRIALAVFLRSSADQPRPVHLWPVLFADKRGITNSAQLRGV